MKTPEECTNMAEVRAEIDRLDRQIVSLLGQRFAYVKAASRYKTSETSVKAPERLEAMLAQRRQWAETEGLSADAIGLPATRAPQRDAIEKVYRDLVSHFTLLLKK